MQGSHHTARRQAARGFTLIELMVAMAITAIIITVLVSITGVATDTWTRSRSEVRAARQAKVMLESMGQDLESLVVRNGNNFEWLLARMEQGVLPQVSENSAVSDPLALTFFTAATDRYLGRVGPGFPGDVSCVSYELRYQDPIQGVAVPENSTFVLYRLLVNPDETFNNLLGQPQIESAFGPYRAQLGDQPNFVCENVHQFSLAFHVEVLLENQNVPQVVRVVMGPSSPNGEFRLTGQGLLTTVPVPGVSPDVLAAGRLKAVEISLSVLSDAGVSRLAAGQPLTQEDYGRNVYHYSRMVELPGM